MKKRSIPLSPPFVLLGFSVTTVLAQVHDHYHQPAVVRQHSAAHHHNQSYSPAKVTHPQAITAVYHVTPVPIHPLHATPVLAPAMTVVVAPPRRSTFLEQIVSILR